MVPTGKNTSLGMTIFIAFSKGTSRSTAVIRHPRVRRDLVLRISLKDEAEPCFPFVKVDDVHRFQTPEARRKLAIETLAFFCGYLVIAR
jgi:hypothetical protein